MGLDGDGDVRGQVHPQAVVGDVPAQHLRERRIATSGHAGESGHGATKSIYGADPDGNHFEIMWMLPQEWGVHASFGLVDHLDLQAEIERRSGSDRRSHHGRTGGGPVMTCRRPADNTTPIVVTGATAARWPCSPPTPGRWDRPTAPA